ncbi:WD repeat-containing protein 72 isoform X2 [Lepisosteus oculatus]|uniref:WD repeat-containing protein 72 isoform X2 n=1 Tax=Lepisosteus oculatus TaxID=7918 RepID=UPI003714F085
MKSSEQYLTMWSKKPPSHSITAIMLADDQATIVTGSREGQICLWDLSSDLKISPKALLFGHTASITCVAKASEFDKKPYVVSASNNGEMSLWNVYSGECVESTLLPYVHIAICYYYCSSRVAGDGWLLCCGEYQDVLLIDTQTLQVLHKFFSRDSSDWISSLCVAHSLKTQEDSLLAISVTGVLKVWSLSSSGNSVQEKSAIYESESRSLQCFQCQGVSFCKYTERRLLVVCSDRWQVYDYSDFSLLCVVLSNAGQCFAGGELLPANRLIVWSKDRDSYIYQLSDRNLTSKEISAHILCYTSERKVSAQVMGFLSERKEPFYQILFCGDEQGKVTLWHLPDVPRLNSNGLPEEIVESAECRFEGCLEKNVPGEITGPLGGHSEGLEMITVTASVSIPSYHQLVCGCDNGKIIVKLALQAAQAQLLGGSSQLKDDQPLKTLQGHSGAVTSLLYPYCKSERFGSSWLLSGGQDSRVIWWDLLTGEILHTFTLQAGPVKKLLVLSEECSPKVHLRVCCFATDNSIAILNLDGPACILHVRKHLFSVNAILWRPVEDFLIVSCVDGSVYVWEIESGTLDRHETGEVAKTILSSCDESQALLIDTGVPVPTAARPSRLHKAHPEDHNPAALSQPETPAANCKHADTDLDKISCHVTAFNPFSLVPLEAGPLNSGTHILTFYVEEILEKLDQASQDGTIALNTFHSFRKPKREPAFDKPATSLKRSKTIFSLQHVNGHLQTFVRDHLFQSERSLDHFPTGEVRLARQASQPVSTRGRRQQPKRLVNINLARDSAGLLLSGLFPWGTDKELDDCCARELGIIPLLTSKPFCLKSKNGHMSLILPGWHPGRLGHIVEGQPSNLIAYRVVELGKQYASSITAEIPLLEAFEDAKKDAFRLKVVSYLLSVVLVVDSLMRLTSPHGQDSQRNGPDLLMANYLKPAREAAQYLVREASSLEKLVTSWQNQSVEVLEAVQAVLLAEVQRIIKTLRKTSISSQTPTVADSGSCEMQLPKIEGMELLELQHTQKIAPQTPVGLVKHDSGSGLAKGQAQEEVSDGCIFEDSDSTGGLSREQFPCCKMC